MRKIFACSQFIGFLLVGATAATVNFVSRIFYANWLSFTLSIILAYITGMVIAFILMRIFVFQKSKLHLHESAVRFTVVNMFAILQTWAIAHLCLLYVLPLLNIVNNTYLISHAIGVALPAISSYLGHKYLSFR